MENNRDLILQEAAAQGAQTLIRPIFEALGTMLKNNTDAMNQIAIAQQMQSSRLEALEKQIRLQTLVTNQQVRYINAAIQKRARETLFKRDAELADNKRACRKIGTAIKKDLLSRYGVAAVAEIPKHEYGVAIQHIELWNDMLVLRDAIKEARGGYA